MHSNAMNYAVDTLLANEGSLDRGVVERVLRAGIPLYTTYLGDIDVTELLQKVSHAQADPGFTLEGARPLFDQTSAQIGALLSRAQEAEDRAHEAEQHPWPAWAEAIFKRLKAVGLYDGEDLSDGVDLAEDFSEWVDGFEAASVESVGRLKNRIETLEAQLADKQTVFAQSLVQYAQETVGMVLAERVAYFRRTKGHYDRQQAAGSYEAATKEVQLALERRLHDVIEEGGGLVRADVVDYRHADGVVKYMVELKVAGRSMTTGIYDVQGRAEFEAAEWGWLLRGGPQPDISDYDVDVDVPAAQKVTLDNPILALDEVRRAVFGDLGDSPDVYADYDRLSELQGEMCRAIRVVGTMMRERNKIVGELHDAKALLLRTVDERMGKAFYIEVCRAEDRIKDIVDLARAAIQKVPDGQLDEKMRRLLTVINEVDAGTLIGEQSSRSEVAINALPDDIRAKGWAVARHNDYSLDGVLHTFWLFTKGAAALQGAGRSDADALGKVRAQIAAEVVLGEA